MNKKILHKNTEFKWKNGLILFLFMFSFYLFLFITTVSGAGRLGTMGTNSFYEWSEVGMASIVILILSLLFVFSLYFTDKKLAQNKYSFLGLIGYNLIVALILYVLSVVVSIIGVSIAISQGAQSEAGMSVLLVIFHGLWVAPLIVLIFSLIPSLIYKKFRDKDKWFKILKIIVLSISTLFFVGTIVNFSTCTLYDNYWCLTHKAIKYDDVSFCEKHDGYGKKTCLSYYHKTHYTRMGSSKDYCEKIESQDVFDVCIFHFATKQNNFELCDKIESEYHFNRCNYFIALETNNVELCNKIKSESQFNHCIENIAEVTMDESLCNKMKSTNKTTSEEWFNECITRLSKNNEELCNNIKPIDSPDTFGIGSKEDCLEKRKRY